MERIELRHREPEAKARPAAPEQQVTTNPLEELIILQIDGEILRSRGPLPEACAGLARAATAMLSMAMQSRQRAWPVWVDVDAGGRRVLAIAFDDQIVFARPVAPGESFSRAALIEQVRGLAQG